MRDCRIPDNYPYHAGFPNSDYANLKPVLAREYPVHLRYRRDIHKQENARDHRSYPGYPCRRRMDRVHGRPRKEPFRIGVLLALTGDVEYKEPLEWAKDTINSQGPVARAMAGDSYTVYIIHPVVLILLALVFSAFALPPAGHLHLFYIRSRNPSCTRGNEGALIGTVFSCPAS